MTAPVADRGAAGREGETGVEEEGGDGSGGGGGCEPGSGHCGGGGGDGGVGGDGESGGGGEDSDGDSGEGASREEDPDLVLLSAALSKASTADSAVDESAGGASASSTLGDAERDR